MDEVTIRPAVVDELDVLLGFEQSMIQAERPFDETIRTGEDVRYYDLEALITAPNVELLVAVLEGTIIGSGYARIEDAKPYLRHQKHSYLGFMYVEPEHRCKGINRRIISALEAWSRSRGVTEMRLEVYGENAPAIRAYEKAGYAGLILQMRKQL